jgi:hypothetical protein
MPASLVDHDCHLDDCIAIHVNALFYVYYRVIIMKPYT